MNLNKAINFLLFSKWKFFYKEKYFLLFDGFRDSKRKLSNILSNQNFSVLYTRGEEINFSIFLSALFSYWPKKLSTRYLIEYIRKTNAKVIVTFFDTHHGFFELKKIFPNKKFIAIQAGIKSKQGLKKLKCNLKSSEIDHYFTINEYYSKQLKKKIKANYTSIGSFNANQIKINKYSTNEIIFISKQTLDYDKPVPHHEFKIIALISKYLEKKKIKLHILLKHDIKNDYLNYLLDRNLNNIKVIYARKKYLLSYKICQKYKLIINTDSTLGYEMLSLKKKVIFINYGSRENDKWIKKNGYPVTPFGYPASGFKDNGFFWTNLFDKKRIINMFEKNYSMDIKKWHNKNLKTISSIIPRDGNNKIVCNCIKK